MDYKLVWTYIVYNEDSNIEEIRQAIFKQINAPLKCGYIPYGKPILFEIWGRIHAMQAMVRYDEEDIIGGIQVVKEMSK